MKRLIILFTIVLCFTTVAIAQGADVDKIESTYYVSSSIGDDGNDGLTAKTPKQHISAVRVKKNVRILLRRGDVFFEQLRDYNNCIFEDYGRGDRPVLCGFKVLMNPQAWTFDGENDCWKLDLQDERNFAGLLHGEDVADDRINNIGFIYNPGTDKIYGQRVRYLKEMTENERFFITEQFVTDSIKSDTFRYLRWKLDSDPRKIKNLCFPMCLIAVRDLNNCELKNIAIVGFNFGIVVCNSTLVENCLVDLIGGAVQLGSSGWVRYGNGIEYSWGNHDNIVKNCLISRTYDCGVTIQASGNIRWSPKNIHFKDNRFYHCRQAFEFFLNTKGDIKPKYENCSFIGNVCYQMGENEFSTPQLRDANLLSYDSSVKYIKIESNTFFGASYFCGTVYPEGLRGNTVYLYEGQYLYNYHGPRIHPVIFANDDDDIEQYKSQSNDNSKIIIMQKNSRFAKSVAKIIKKNVGWKPVKLNFDRLKI